MDPVCHVGPRTQQFQFGPWEVTASRDHILKSEGPERERFESQLKLPQVPEMIFADNVLRIIHQDGYGIEFNALDALKLVDPEHDLMKVAVADAWREARADSEHINDVIKPFDWTFTTDYKGTIIGEGDKSINVSQTTERIDIERLKVREKILFYEDILLFEDELADNGTSVLNVKIRVMPSCFFVLMRQYMRVDNVLVRLNETRVFHEGIKNYILREFTTKEKALKELNVPMHVLQDPNEIGQHLTLKTEIFEKLEFPESRTVGDEEAR